jgi:hypothetical protein
MHEVIDKLWINVLGNVKYQRGIPDRANPSNTEGTKWQCVGRIYTPSW